MTTKKTSNARVFQPAIDITLTGLVAVFVDPARKECKVGLLRKTPHIHAHKLEVQTTELDNLDGVIKSHKGVTSVQHILKLTTPQGISLRKWNVNINRRVRPSDTDPDRDSFKWVVDLEGPEFYEEQAPIGAKEDGFFPFLTFDSGELYTFKISETELERLDPGDTVYRPFGYVAVEIGIHIPLPTGVQATLTNGFKTVFKSQANRRYEIRVDRGPVHKPTGTVTDAETYYEDGAIGRRLADDEKIHFQSHVKPKKAGPEAACFTPFLKESNPG